LERHVIGITVTRVLEGDGVPIPGCGELLIEAVEQETLQRQRRGCGNGGAAEEQASQQNREQAATQSQVPTRLTAPPTHVPATLRT
jgi:hypothetical protein